MTTTLLKNILDITICVVNEFCDNGGGRGGGGGINRRDGSSGIYIGFCPRDESGGGGGGGGRL